MTTILITAVLLNAALLAVYVFRPRPSWTDDDHYALVERYAESTSALTAMKAELDKLQEQLEFSEDVRYTLGTGNAKMAQRIEELERDASRGEDVRGVLVDWLDKEIDMRLAFGKRLTEVQRSLRIARHKEFKRWKKDVRKNGYATGLPSPRVIENGLRAQNINTLSLYRNLHRVHPGRGHDSKFHEFMFVSRRQGPFPLP